MTWDPAGVTSGPMDGAGTWSAAGSNWFNGTASGNTWSNTTGDTAYFGSSSSPNNNYTVTISGVVNAGAIVLGYPSSNTTGYTIQNGTINGPAGGTLNISVPNGNFFTRDSFYNVAFTGAANYQFDGSTTVAGGGLAVTGNTTFSGNVILGNGTDTGTLSWVSGNPVGANSITVNSGTGGGWTLYVSGGTETSVLHLNSLGNRLNGGLCFAAANTINWAGAITLGADASIMQGGGNNTYAVSGNISGNHNLYLGSWGQVAAGQFAQMVISGTNTYTGATVLMDVNTNPAAGVINDPVVLGANNTLPVGTTIVIGANGGQSPYTGIAAPNSLINPGASVGGAWGGSDSALDLHGYNQTVAGLATGAGRTASNQFIGNYLNGSTSTLTISGTTTPTSGFGGNITDHFGVAGDTGVTALAVGPGGVLSLTGTNSYTGATTVNAGTLKLDFSATGAPAANIINNVTNGSSLVLGAGTLTLVQKAGSANTQQFNGLTVNAGQSSIVLNGATGNTLVLSLGAITDAIGGAVNFILPSGTQSASNGITTTNVNDAYGLLGGWATVTGTGFAAVSSGNIVAFSGYENVNDVSTWGASGANGVISNTGAFVNSLGSSGTIGALRINSAASGTADLGGNTLTIADGAILVTPSATGGQAINNGTLTSGTAQLTVTQNASGTLTIGASIADNGATHVAFTKNGTGALLLNGSNSYSGGTTINSGTLQMGNANALGAAGSPLAINSATLDLDGASVTSGALSGLAGGLITNSGAAAVLTVNSSSNSTFNGSISNGTGAVGLAKGGSGTLALSASNNYSGPTAINGGILSLGNAYALGNTSALSFGGGTLQYSSANQVDYSGFIAGSGSAISIDTNGQNVAFSSVLASSNTGGLTKLGAGVLTLTGTENYTGPTTISAGSLQLGNGTVGGAIASGTSILDNGVLIFNEPGSQTYAGTITGSGALTNAGSGVQILSGSNSYTGGTVLNAGVLDLGNANALAATGNVSFGGGTLQYSASNNADYSSRFASTGGAISIDTNGQNVAFGSAFIGTITSGLTKSGSGTLTLNFTDKNLSGPITINGGTLRLGSGADPWTNNYGGSTVPLVINNGTYDINNTEIWTGLITGTSGSGVVTNNGAARNSVLLAGPAGISGTFAGGFQNGTGLLDVDYRGSGQTWVLSGSSNMNSFSSGNVSPGSTIIIPVGAYFGASLIAIGNNGTGSVLNVNGGTVAVTNGANTLRIGWSGAGIVNLNSGSIIAPYVNRQGGSSSADGINLNGGILYTQQIKNDTLATAGMTLTLNGGTIVSTANDNLFADGGQYAANELSVQIGTGGAAINTNGFTSSSQRPLNNVTGQSTAGTLTETGPGSLNLSGSGTFTGTTLITGGGTVKISQDGNLGASPSSLVSNQVEINGGTLNFSSMLTGATLTSGSGSMTNFTPSGNFTTGGVAGAFIKLNNGITGFANGLGGVGLDNGVTVTIAAPDLPGGVQATANAIITNGTISGYTITNPGSGYSFSPAITLTPVNGGTIPGGSLTAGGNAPGSAPSVGQFTMEGNPVIWSEGIVSSTPSITLSNYAGGASATFTTSTSATISANRGIQLDAGGGTLDVSNYPTGFTATVNAPISGIGALTKTSGGVLVLTGSNSYQGGTAVAAGTLRVANANALGAATGNLAVNGGTLDLFGNNVAAGALSGSSAGVITTSLDPDVTLTVGGAGAGTFNGVIQDGSGQLSLTKAGTGILTLGGANTYTGTTLINGGVLAVNNANALSGGGNIIFGGGTLRYVGATTDYSSLIVNSGSAVSIDTGSQTVTFGAPLAASNTGGLTVSSNAGNGVLILQGPQLYSGVTTITSGALWLGDGFSLDDGSLNNSASIVDNASLVFQTGGAENYTGSISGAGTVAMTSRGVQTLSGSNSYSGGTSLSGSGTLDYANVNALGTGPATFLNAATLQAGVAGTLGNNLVFSPGVTGTFDTQANSVTLSGVISGGGAFAKVGSGTLTVSNSNSFTGATSVNAGTLIISGSLSGSSSVSVAAAAALEVDGYLNNSAVTTVNGTLQGNGALGGITARGGTIAPGLTAANSTTATAALTAAGAVTLSGSTNFDIRLGLLGSGTDSDQLIATAGNNAVSLDGANLQLTIGSNFKNSAQISSFYLIIDGGARGTGAGNEFAQGTSFTTDGYTFTIDYATNFINSTTVSNIGTGNDVVLELTAVPEPGTIATVISGFGMLVFMMRSRRRAR